MRVNNNQNSPSFQAKIGRVEAKKILEKFGKETLDEIELLLPKIIKDEEKFGDSTFTYSFGLSSLDSFCVACEKKFEKNYPEAKTKLGKVLTIIKKDFTSGFGAMQTLKRYDDTVETMTIRSKEDLLATQKAKRYETFNSNQAHNAKIKKAEQEFKVRLENLKKNS